MTINNKPGISSDPMLEPARYDAWYETPRGSWIGNTESNLLLSMLQSTPGSTLLDVGCGTGYFSEHFANTSLDVVGLDNNINSLLFAKNKRPFITYIRGTADKLPFVENTFDYVSAVTSLCFIKDLQMALSEMWRVSKTGVILGLLNVNSLLYHQKHSSGGYKNSRWDNPQQVRIWLQGLLPLPHDFKIRTAVFFPGGGLFSRYIEKIVPNKLLWGGFLVVYALKTPVLK